MAFDKRTFNKIIKEHFTSLGYTMHKNREDYYIDCPDGITRIVVRIPNGIQGFVVGAQFADWKPLTGKFNNILVVFDVGSLVLIGASVRDYSEDDIKAGAETITDALAPYVIGGKEAIRANTNDFYEDEPDRWGVPARNMNEKWANEMQEYFKFPTVEVYSDKYRESHAKRLRECTAMTCSVDMEAYLEHKEHYDGYAQLGCTVEPMEDSVWIRGIPKAKKY